MPTAKYTLKPFPQRRSFRSGLNAMADVRWQEKKEQYCDYRLDGDSPQGWLRAKQFSNGTLYLEASTDDLLGRMTALLTGSTPASPSASTTKPGLAKPASKPSAGASRSGVIDIKGDYIGTDESGKGDFFGPLVIAGVHISEEQGNTLTAMGVMDSKKLTDARIESLIEKIYTVVGEEAIASVELTPDLYNTMYSQYKNTGKNLNHLLAWGHATVLEALLARFPTCQQAIADQFGNERYILSQLQERGQGIHLSQTPRAEANVGVAAASVIARWRFTHNIKELSTRFGISLPLGAGPIVKRVARQFIAQHGRDELSNVVKLHFKTTNEL